MSYFSRILGLPVVQEAAYSLKMPFEAGHIISEEVAKHLSLTLRGLMPHWGGSSIPFLARPTTTREPLPEFFGRDRYLSLGELYPGAPIGDAPMTFLVHIYPRAHLLRRAEDLLLRFAEERKRHWSDLGTEGTNIYIPYFEHIDQLSPKTESLSEFERRINKKVEYLDLAFVKRSLWVSEDLAQRAFRVIIEKAKTSGISIELPELRKGIDEIRVSPVLTDDVFQAFIPISDAVAKKLGESLTKFALRELTFDLRINEVRNVMKKSFLILQNRAREARIRYGRIIEELDNVRERVEEHAREFVLLAGHPLVQDTARQFVIDHRGRVIFSEMLSAPIETIPDYPGARRTTSDMSRYRSYSGEEVSRGQVVGVQSTLIGRLSGYWTLHYTAAPLPDEESMLLAAATGDPDTIWNTPLSEIVPVDQSPRPEIEIEPGKLSITAPGDYFNAYQPHGLSCGCSPGAGGADGSIHQVTLPDGREFAFKWHSSIQIPNVDEARRIAIHLNPAVENALPLLSTDYVNPHLDDSYNGLIPRGPDMVEAYSRSRLGYTGGWVFPETA